MKIVDVVSDEGVEVLCMVGCVWQGAVVTASVGAGEGVVVGGGEAPFP